MSLVCACLFCFRLGERPLNSSHEARAAQNAQTILDDDDWVLPRLFDRRVELQKPPLYYWLVALLGRLQGGVVDAWAVRLPAALAALATVLALYGFGVWQGRALAGVVAAAVLATCCHFTWLARVGRIDMPLTLTVTLALLGFYLGRRQQRGGATAWPWFALSYVAVAAGLLLKGPIAAVLPAAVAGVSLLADRLEKGVGSRFRITSPRNRIPTPFSSLGWGVPLVLALAGPWYVLADLQTAGDWSRAFFWHHNVERGFGGDDGPRPRPWAFYGPHLFADALPWSVCLPAALWWLLRRGRWRQDTAARFGLVWLATVTLLLSCMRFKRADYLLPAYPGAALLLGCVAEQVWPTLRLRYRLLAPGAFVLMIGACVVGWWVYLNSCSDDAAANVAQRFAAKVRGRTELPVLFFCAEDHELAFHVGAPIETLLEWENLDLWLKSPLPFYVVMPADCAAQWPQHLKNGCLEEVRRSSDLTEAPLHRPLVLLRARR